MSFKGALERARAGRPEPKLVQVAVDDELYQVEVMRLDGMDWAAVMAECPPTGAKDVALGYDTSKAALLACKKYSRLLDSEGEPVEDLDWNDLFAAISGVEIGGLAATWWALNVHDPNQRVVALKKALAGGGKTSSS